MNNPEILKAIQETKRTILKETEQVLVRKQEKAVNLRDNPLRVHEDNEILTITTVRWDKGRIIVTINNEPDDEEDMEMFSVNTMVAIYETIAK